MEQIIDVELSSQEKGFNGLLKTVCNFFSKFLDYFLTIFPFQVFEPKESKEDSKVKKEIPQTLIKSSKQIVSELVNSIMKLEQSDTHRLVGCIQALHSYAYIQPKLLVEHAITLEPYLNIHCEPSDGPRTKFISLLAEILEQVGCGFILHFVCPSGIKLCKLHRGRNWIKFCTLFRGGNWITFCTLFKGVKWTKFINF